MKFKIGAVQMTSGSDKKKNLAKAESLLTAGIDQGATLLALPENFSFMGSEAEKLLAAEEESGGEAIDFLKNLAIREGVWILAGSIPIKASPGKVFNSSLLIGSDDAIAARYDKIHLFDVNVPDGESHCESKTVEPGRSPVIAETPFGKLGLTICYDLRFPELYRRLAKEGATILFVPAAFTVETGKAHWEVLLRARAIENQVYVVAPAQAGRHSKTRQTFGHSMIIDPWGKVIARLEDEEGVITAEVDLSLVEKVRSGVPVLDHIVLGGETP